MDNLEIIDAKYNEDDNTVYVNAIKNSTLSSVTFTTMLKNESMDTAVMACLMEMAEWKDKEFWSLDNIEKIIVTYNSFPDRSCPGELVKKTIEKLKPESTKQ